MKSLWEFSLTNCSIAKKLKITFPDALFSCSVYKHKQALNHERWRLEHTHSSFGVVLKPIPFLKARPHTANTIIITVNTIVLKITVAHNNGNVHTTHYNNDVKNDVVGQQFQSDCLNDKKSDSQ